MRFKICGDDGDPCPRCGQPTQIREHVEIGPRQLRQQFYYSRWFYCNNMNCKATLIMPPRYIIENAVSQDNPVEIWGDSWA